MPKRKSKASKKSSRNRAELLKVTKKFKVDKVKQEETQRLTDQLVEKILHQKTDTNNNEKAQKSTENIICKLEQVQIGSSVKIQKEIDQIDQQFDKLEIESDQMNQCNLSPQQ